MRDNLDRGMDILMRSDEIARIKLNKMILRGADLVISPDVSDYHWAEFSSHNEIINIGREAASGAHEKLMSLSISLPEKTRPWYRNLFRWLSSD